MGGIPPGRPVWCSREFVGSWASWKCKLLKVVVPLPFKRNDSFINSDIWCSYHRREESLQGPAWSLGSLGIWWFISTCYMTVGKVGEGFSVQFVFLGPFKPFLNSWKVEGKIFRWLLMWRLSRGSGSTADTFACGTRHKTVLEILEFPPLSSAHATLHQSRWVDTSSNLNLKHNKIYKMRLCCTPQCHCLPHHSDFEVVKAFPVQVWVLMISMTFVHQPLSRSGSC